MTDRIQVPMADATPAQLREFATTVLGIEVAPTTPAAGIRAKIGAAGWDKDTITIAGSSVPGPVITATKASDLAATGEEGWSTVLIQKSNEKMGDQPVFVSVNGVGMFIERGRPSRIKNRYVEALQNAVETIYEQDTSDLRAPLIPRDVHRFPFSIISAG
jgi:hypothetical protein